MDLNYSNNVTNEGEMNESGGSNSSKDSLPLFIRSRTLKISVPTLPTEQYISILRQKYPSLKLANNLETKIMKIHNEAAKLIRAAWDEPILWNVTIRELIFWFKAYQTWEMLNSRQASRDQDNDLAFNTFQIYGTRLASERNREALLTLIRNNFGKADFTGSNISVRSFGIVCGNFQLLLSNQSKTLVATKHSNNYFILEEPKDIIKIITLDSKGTNSRSSSAHNSPFLSSKSNRNESPNNKPNYSVNIFGDHWSVIPQISAFLFKSLGWGLQSGIPLLLNSSQTSLICSDYVRYLGNIMERTVHLVNINNQTEILELIGTNLPNNSSNLPILVRSIQNGDWIFFNFLQENRSIISMLYSLLDCIIEGTSTWNFSGRSFLISPQFRILVCIDPLLSSKQNLSFLNRFVVLHVPEEVHQQYQADLVSYLSSILNLQDVFTPSSSPPPSSPRSVSNDSLLLKVYYTMGNPQTSTEGILNYMKQSKREDILNYLEKCFTQNQPDTNLPFVPPFVETIIGNNFSSNGKFAYVIHKDSQQFIQIQAVAMCIVCNLPVLLEGNAATGKTSLIEFLSRNDIQIPRKLERVSNSCDTTIEEYVGSFRPGTNNEITFIDGPLVRSLKEGHWFLSDEMNLAPLSIVYMLQPIIEGKNNFYLPGYGYIQRHPDFRFFATQNPTSYGNGRNPLPQSIANLLVLVKFTPFNDDFLRNIVQRNFETRYRYASKNLISICEKMIIVFHKTNSLIENSNHPNLTLRDLLKWVRRCNRDTKTTIWQHGIDLLCSQFSDPTLREQVTNLILEIFKEDISSRSSKSEAVPIKELILRCVRNLEPVLLVGPTSGKTYSVKNVIPDARSFHCSRETEVTDIFGQYVLVNRERAITYMLDLVDSLQNTIQQISGRKRLTRYTQEITEILTKWKTSFGDDTLQIEKDIVERVEAIKSAFSDTEKKFLSDDEERDQLAARCLLYTHRFQNMVQSFLAETNTTTATTKLSSRTVVFMDGIVPECILKDRPLFMENVDKMDKALIECLNNLLDVNRSFTLNSDNCLTSDLSNLPITEKFCFLATVHVRDKESIIKLSPAIRSRFTEVWMDPYTSEFVQSLLKDRLFSPKSRNFQGETARSLREHEKLFNLVLETVKPNIRQGFNIVNFVLAHWEIFSQFKAPLPFKRALYLALVNHVDEEIRNNLFSMENQTLFNEVQISPHSPFEYKDQQILYDWLRISIGPIKPIPLNLVPTTSLLKNIYSIFNAVISGDNLLLEGPPGIGKSAVVQSTALLTGNQYVRIAFSGSTTSRDLFGHRGMGNEGPLVRALLNKYWILFDEINLAPPETLEALSPLLDPSNEEFTLPDSNQTILLKDIPIFATMNPTSVKGNRKQLPASFENFFTRIPLYNISWEETKEICLKDKMMSKIFTQCKPGFLDLLFTSHQEISRLENKLTTTISLRDLQKLAAVMNIFLNTPSSTTTTDSKQQLISDLESYLACCVVFVARLPSSDDQQEAMAILQRVLLNKSEPQLRDLVTIQRESKHSIFSFIWEYSITNVYVKYFSSSSVPQELGNITAFTNLTNKLLLYIAMAAHSQKPVLLKGESGAGKTWLVKKLAKLVGQKLIVFPMHVDLESTDLTAKQLPSLSNGKFELKTFYSPLITAIKEGCWILFENVNGVPQDVFERLNPLLEDPTGKFDVYETSESFPIPDSFRIFLTCDVTRPQSFPLSQALIDRVLELHLPSLLERQDKIPLIEVKKESLFFLKNPFKNFFLNKSKLVSLKLSEKDFTQERANLVNNFKTSDDSSSGSIETLYNLKTMIQLLEKKNIGSKNSSNILQQKETLLQQYLIEEENRTKQ